MIQKLTTAEAEAAAYLAGDLDRAALLGRLDSLQRALGQAVATLESIGEMREAKHARGAAAETLATIGQTFDLWDIEGETV
jgi:hypothetical protein